ncbi:MAG: DNA (cytosine-5-)-methyltransferase [Rhizobiales bacterium]|nr:DNA (cytosine-5-)-methyltransferase [Hyphomicrobiales bacterium]
MLNSNQTALNVISLFDGMSCGRIALDRANINVKNYYASEIEKPPILVSQSNWDDITHVGDVTKWNTWRSVNFPTIDLLIGGSPCQSFSMAGKRKGMATNCEVEVINLAQYQKLKAEGMTFEGQSYLFWEFVQILRHLQNCNPKMYFLLENVKMAKKWEDVISEALGVAPVLINSALVSAQNRQRLYWTNISFNRNIHDLGIKLIDILDLHLPSDDLGVAIRNKSCTVRSSGRVSPFGEGHDWDSPYIKTDKELKAKTKQDKASCLTGGGNSGGNHSDMDIMVYQYPRGNNKGGVRITDKAPTMTSSRWEQNVFIAKAKTNHTKNYLEWENNQGNKHQQQRALYPTTEKTGALPACHRGDKMNVVIGEDGENYTIRRFTVAECEKLQTVPVGYCKATSKSQAYKMLGNGWTVDVIAIILSGISNPSANANHQPLKPQIQQDLFSEVMA